MENQHKYNYIITRDDIANILAGGKVVLQLPISENMQHGECVHIILKPEPLSEMYKQNNR